MFYTELEGQVVSIEVKPDELLFIVIKSKREVIVNEVAKEKALIEPIKQKLLLPC